MEIELQVVGRRFEDFFVRNKGSKDKSEQVKIKEQLDQAMKLEELVKEKIKYLKGSSLETGDVNTIVLLKFLMEQSKK